MENTKEMYNKAQNDIKNCLYCLQNGPITVELADDIFKVAEDLYLELRDAYAKLNENDKTEVGETVAYARDFMRAAEKLDDAMNALQDLEIDFVEYEQE